MIIAWLHGEGIILRIPEQRLYQQDYTTTPQSKPSTICDSIKAYSNPIIVDQWQINNWLRVYSSRGSILRSYQYVLCVPPPNVVQFCCENLIIIIVWLLIHNLSFLSFQSVSDQDLVFDDIESSHLVIPESRKKRDSESPQIVANDLDELLNGEDSDEEFDVDEEDEEEEAVAPSTSNLDEDNHWLLRSVKRIRRSIGDLLGGPSSKFEDDVENHTKKMRKRKGKGKGKGKGKKGSKKNRSKDDLPIVHLKKEDEKHHTKEEKKARNEKQHEAMHRPVSRIRRQHVISNDDEDLADGSGSGPSFITNRLCK